MKEHARQRALDVLNTITPIFALKTVRRSKEFLCSPVISPSTEERPDAWEGGMCTDWAFDVPVSMAMALDVQLTPKIAKWFEVLENEVEVKKLEWSQGSAFSFNSGYTFYDSKAARQNGVHWGDVIPLVTRSIQVIDAIPATPASFEVLRYKETPHNITALCRKLYEDGKVFSWGATSLKGKTVPTYEFRIAKPRNPGSVHFRFYHRSQDNKNLYPAEEKFTTQDTFIRLLITGKMYE